MKKLTSFCSALCLLIVSSSAYALTDIAVPTAAADGGNYRFTADTTLTIGDGVSISADTGISVTTQTDDQGTIDITNSTGTTTFSGGIGSAGVRDIKQINISTTQTVVFGGDLLVQNAFGLHFVSDGVVTFNSGVDFRDTLSADGSIVNDASARGTLNLEGTNIITGDVGEGGGDGLKQLNVNGAGSSITRTLTTNGLNLNSYTLNVGTTLDISPTASGTLAVDVLSASSYGRLISAGAATVGSNTLISVDVQGYVPSGQVLTIVDGTGGGGVAGGLAVTDNSAIMSFTSNAAAGADLTLTVSNNFSAGATGGNGGGPASALGDIDRGGASGDIATVLGALQGLADASAVQNAVGQLDPEALSGVRQATFDAGLLAAGTLQAHLGEQRSAVASRSSSGISTGDAWQDRQVWTKGFGTTADQDAREGAAGFESDAWGVLGGLDVEVAADTRLGFAAGYASTAVGFDADSGQTDVTTYPGIVYLAWDDSSPWYWNAGFEFAWHEYDGTRNIRFGSVNRTAQADYDGQQYSVFLDGGYVIQKDGWEWTPLASLHYSRLEIGGYTETGAASLNLTVEDQNYDLLQSGLGLKLAHPIASDAGSWVPEAHVRWLYDIVDDAASTTSTFQAGGSSFTTEGLDPADHALNAGAGLTLYAKGDITLSGTYDLELREDYISHTGQGVVRFKF